MDAALKIAALAVTAAILATILRKTQPESAMLVTLAAGLALVISVWVYVTHIAEYFQNLCSAVPAVEDVAGPLFRAAAVSVLTRISAEMCRDSGEGALAAKVEFGGTVICIALILPLFDEVMELVTALI